MRAKFNSLPKWVECHKDHSGSECLFWPFASNRRGYPAVSINGRLWGVHRFFCEYRNGPPPSSLHQAAHTCGNGRIGCVNPLHVVWKTQKDNEADKIAHGTHLKGECHPQSKLTVPDVIAIRQSTGVPIRTLAEKYGVTIRQIFNVRSTQHWKAVDVGSDGL